MCSKLGKRLKFGNLTVLKLNKVSLCCSKENEAENDRKCREHFLIIYLPLHCFNQFCFIS